MRLFRRAQDTKTSVIRREAVSSNGETGPMLVPAAPVSSRPVISEAVEPEQVFDGFEDSDVYLCKDRPAAVPLVREVTLFVHGWHNVEPGTLSWVFPSVTAAVAAARAMKNAVRWAIVAGRREASDDDLVDARAHGAVLIEQAG